MIPTKLLANYQNRALGACVYGNGGLKKTLAVRTLVPPTALYDFEGGSGCLGPWTRRIRLWSESKWTEYSQEQRVHLLEMVSKSVRFVNVGGISVDLAILQPAPLIDIISFNDVLSQDINTKTSPAYDHFFSLVANFEVGNYNSLAIDPLLEMSQLTQSQSKLKSGASAFEPMAVQWWQGAQERAGIVLRRLRNYRDQGVFIYMTSSEFVDKDYGTDPRSKTQGQTSEEPYAIKGTLNVPGKLVGAVNHMLDLQFHARSLNGAATWVTQEENARSGSFNWEAKDRTGRIQDRYIAPNFREVVKSVYGEEAFKEMYSLWKK